MKRKLWIMLALAVLMAALGCGAALADDSGSCGNNVNYTFTSSTGRLSITGTGAMTDFLFDSSVPWYSYRTSITSVTIGRGVTRIGNAAFYYCTNLTSVTIPDSVTRIGNDAFYDTALTSVTIPDSVTNIGQRAFAFTGLTSVTIPDSVDSIGPSAFAYCTGLTSVSILNPYCIIGDDNHDVFNGCSIPYLNGFAGSTAETYAGYSNSNVTFLPLSGSCGDNVTWTFDPTTGVMTISGSGKMNLMYHASSPWKHLRDQITSVVIRYGVTNIGEGAFEYCGILTSVTIPDSVEEIEFRAFAHCGLLDGVTIPEGVTSIGLGAFADCYSLTSVTIPVTVTSIGNYAFENCTNLSSVFIENHAAVIGDSNYDDVFYGCSSALVLYGGVGSTTEAYANATGISFKPFYGTCGSGVQWRFDRTTGQLTVGGTGGAMHFSNYPFAPWEALRSDITSVLIGDVVTSIEDYAFWACDSLTDVDIPDSVTDIGYMAFKDCISLRGVVIPDSVTGIGEFCFENCSTMTDLTIGNSVETIGRYTFAGCDSLMDVVTPDTVTSIGEAAFWHCDRLTDVTIGSGVTDIGEYAFADCLCLSSVTIPDSVTNLGNHAFSGCSYLQSLTLGAGLSAIGPDTFAGCSSLTEVTIPVGVAQIGHDAFAECTGLRGVTILNPDAVIGNNDFDVFPVPQPSLVIYGWSGSTAETYANAAGITFESLGNISGQCGDNVTYSFDPVTGVLTISGTGEMTGYQADYMAVYAPWYGMRTDITSVVIEYGVETIGSYAFFGCNGITGATIPDSVTNIQYNAFEGCSALTNLTIPDSVTQIGGYAFYDCAGLTDVTIPTGVTTISSGAFAATGLTRVTIPENVTKINDMSFYGCSALTDVTILCPDAMIGYEFGDEFYDVFDDCSADLVIHGWAGSTAEAYAAGAGICFEPLVPDPDFFLPAALTDIESEAFSGIAARAVVIPKNIRSISGNPFAGSAVQYIYGFPGTAAETLARNYPAQFTFIAMTDAWYARLTD